MTCKLCLEPKKLVRKSHILSRFFFEDMGMFNDDHFVFPIELNTSNVLLTPKKRKPDSLWESDIFCDECEGRMRDYESILKPVLFGGKQGFKVASIREYGGRIKLFSNHYSAIKLGLLANLFRMSICSKKEIPFELSNIINEDLRRMILNGNAGCWYEYPIIIALNNISGNVFFPPLLVINIVGLAFGKLIFYFLLSIPPSTNLEILKELTMNEESCSLITINNNHENIFKSLLNIEYVPVHNQQL